jgi:type IV pilus assembly protein PilM
MGLFHLEDNSVFGLDIGFETIKLVELRKSKHSIKLVGAKEVRLTERILERDSFRNKAATANLIKEACRSALPGPIRAKKIITALPENFVFSKTIQMPKMSQQELEKSIIIEAAQYLPIPVEEAYLDFQTLIVHPDEPLADILLVAAPKKLVDDYVEMTGIAGLELSAIETKPIAVGRAVNASINLNGLVIIEIGTELSRISIWDNNEIRLISSVNTGKNQILEAVTDPRQEILSEEGKKVVLNISNEVINAIKYHKNRDYKPNPIETILTSGSGANIHGINQFIESEVKIKTDTVLPRIDGKNNLGPEFITAYGLALRNESE